MSTKYFLFSVVFIRGKKKSTIPFKAEYIWVSWTPDATRSCCFSAAAQSQVYITCAIKSYSVCIQWDIFSALHKTNTSENEHLYLNRDDDLLPVGLLNCPTYHSHSSRTCHNIPRNFSINFRGNWVAFLVLEILYSPTQIVSEMNKSLFCTQEKEYSICNTLFSYFIFLLNQKIFHLLNLPWAQLNKSINFAPLSNEFNSCNIQIWLSAKIRDIAFIYSCSFQGFSLLNPWTW